MLYTLRMCDRMANVVALHLGSWMCLKTLNNNKTYQMKRSKKKKI